MAAVHVCQSAQSELVSERDRGVADLRAVACQREWSGARMSICMIGRVHQRSTVRSCKDSTVWC